MRLPRVKVSVCRLYEQSLLLVLPFGIVVLQKTVPVRFAPVRFAYIRFAPDRFALARFALARFAPDRSAPWQAGAQAGVARPIRVR